MNPRSYPTRPRYRTKRSSPSSELKRAQRSSVVVGGLALASLIAVASVIGLVLWPLSGGDDNQGAPRVAALDATRPSDVILVLSTPTPRPEPTPLPTATPRPIPVSDPSLTAEEIDDTLRFAHEMLDFEAKQRQINRDYRLYNVDLLSRWVGESYSGAEVLLVRQLALLDDLGSVEQSVEQEAVVLAMYEDSVREEAEAFEGLVAALHPLNEAGVSIVAGIRTGMLTYFGASEGLSRAAMLRRSAREELELLVSRIGMRLDDLETRHDAENGMF